MQYSNETNQILISMFNGPPIDRDIFDPCVLGRLYDDRYIQKIGGFYSNDVVLTDAGKAYVESLLASQERKRIEKFRFWVPVIISILALLIALVSLGIDFIQLLATT